MHISQKNLLLHKESFVQEIKIPNPRLAILYKKFLKELQYYNDSEDEEKQKEEEEIKCNENWWL